MTVKQFTGMLDTILPVMIYEYGDEFGPYDKDEIPKMFLDCEVDTVFVDDDISNIGLDVTA